MKKLLCSLMTFGLLLTGCSNDSSKSDNDTKEIGIIQYAPHPALDKALEGFKDGIEEAGMKVKYVEKNAAGDQSNCETIADQLVNEGCDLIYAIATPAAQAVANKTTDIPVVLSAVTNPEVAGLVESNEKPNTNITGASDLNPVADQMELLTQLVPNAKDIAIMYCGSEANSEYQGEVAMEAAKKLGLNATIETVADSNEIQSKAESFIGKYDAVYIPTDNLLAEYMSTVTSVTNEHNLPVIVGESGMCSNGGLATYSLDYYELGKIAAKQAIAILNGEKTAEETPIAFIEAKDCQLIINHEVADKLGIVIPDEIAQKAIDTKDVE